MVATLLPQLGHAAHADADFMTQPASFVVFADDWGRHPSSCQHLFHRLLPRYPTYWINTIGMRRPRLDLATLQRAFEKFVQWFRRAPTAVESLPPNLHVSNPRMWPFFSSPLDRRINRALLGRHLRRLTAALPAAPVAVTTIPVVADILQDFPHWRWVYYCVDDFGVWPGVDQRAMRRMEEKLVRQCDRVIAVSETLRDKLAGMGRRAELLTHGADLEHWTTPAVGQASSLSDQQTGWKPVPRDDSLPELRHLPRPLIVFWGVVDRRMESAWVKRLAASLTDGTIVLAGPQADPEPGLLQTPRVAYLHPLPYDRLPLLAREASVLIMPYADLPVTRAMQPLKLKEYLATGKPVVVRDLPANRSWADCMDVTTTPEAFVEAVRTRLHHGLPNDQRAARRRLQDESWDAKAHCFEQWVIDDGGR